MKRLITGFLAIVLLAAMILPTIRVPATAATPSRYCVLVLDNSGTQTFAKNGVEIYTANTAVEHVKTAAVSFLRDLLQAPGNNYVAIVTYTDSADTLSGFTNNISSLQQKVNNISEENSRRDIAAGLRAAKELLADITDANATKNVVLFTTGMTDSGSYDYDGYYDKSVTGSGWKQSSTNVYLYGYANEAIAVSQELKEMATVYTLGLFQTLAQIPADGKDIAEFFRITARDLASAEDCFFDVNDPSDLEFAFSEIADDITIEPKRFKFAGMINQTQDTEAEYYYHDNYFFRNASQYNPSLATMSLCLELSCWSSWEKTAWFDKEKPKSLDDKLVNIKTLLMGDDSAGKGYEGIGFEDFSANDHWCEEPKMNSIGVCAARKTITNKQQQSYTLIAVAVRGGGYSSEWGGNFVIGKDGNHEGFDIAKKDAIAFLKDYIKSVKKEYPTQEIKLWLVGYSRAGAVANMLAGALADNHNLLGYPIEQENVFCYTFEAPQGVLASRATGDYSNIHNTLNLNDLVPMVAPSAWDFVRYNYTNDITLPSRYTTKKELFQMQEKAMRDELAELGFGPDTFEYKISEYTTIKKLAIDRTKSLLLGVPVWHTIDRTAATHDVLQDGVDLLAYLLVGREHYAASLEDTVSNVLSILTHYTGAGVGMATYAEDLAEYFSLETMMYIMAPIFSLNPFYTKEARMIEVSARASMKTATIFDELAEIAGGLAALSDALSKLATQIAAEALINNTYSFDLTLHFINVLVSSNFQGHYPEICLAWCRSLDPNYNTALSQEPSSAVTRIIRINCPVDVRVYDENNQIVASIVDDKPAENNDLICYLNDNGEKIVYLPANGDYRIDIQATGTGDFHYSVGEYSFAHEKMVHLENYYNIPISQGDALTAEIPAASRDALRENALTGTDTDYTLEKNGRELSADETFSGRDAGRLQKTVAITTQGNGGYATGAGTFIQGSVAQVEATLLPKGKFLGWQTADGTILSTELVYRFPVQENCAIIAVFSDVTYSELVLNASEGGKIVAESGHFPEGMEITMAAVADEGYRFVGWSTNAGTLDDKESAEIVFRMPGTNATVTAEFEKIEKDEDTPKRTSNKNNKAIDYQMIIFVVVGILLIAGITVAVAILINNRKH